MSVHSKGLGPKGWRRKTLAQRHAERAAREQKAAEDFQKGQREFLAEAARIEKENNNGNSK